jgi:NAD(P)-dependent dehydrogenase (short-subunit alcohol dehydrogenase family)
VSNQDDEDDCKPPTVAATADNLTPLFAQQARRAVSEKKKAAEAAKDAAGAIRWIGRTDGDAGTSTGTGTGTGADGDGGRGGAPLLTPAQLSQIPLTTEDVAYQDGGGGAAAAAVAALPLGRLDVNGQQIDLRTSNSWLLKLDAVSTPELVEVFAINTLAPFLLNARLQPLLAATAAKRPPDSSATSDVEGGAFIVNVSAMEGKFYRHKTPNHPHTNMAKAALNMMTRTSAADLAKSHRIYMTAVDTGWINDENPRDKAARNAEVNHFQTPIDEIDAAARVLHPVFEGLTTGSPKFGVFLKDYAETEW